ncbi:MAG: hypothetical protein ABI594_04720 [Ginsengibacter sp.]
MKINRDNYEEYFLLYADNELPDHDKIDVLKFISQNKDLESEFKMIQETICKPETNVTLHDKSFLLKDAEGDFITEKNYEKIFVLYHDDELSNGQRNKTDLFLSRHPQLKSEFDLIGKAKLECDSSIVFPGKNKLYKKENAGKVVPLIFWRSMAAAVLIGLGFWIIQRYNTPQTIPQPVAVNVKPVNKNLSKQNTSPLLIDKKDSEVANTEKPKDNNSLPEKIAEQETAVKKIEKENNDFNTTSLVKTTIKNKKTAVEKQDIIIPAEEKIKDEVVISPSRINDAPEITASTKVENTFAGDTEVKPFPSENEQPAMQAHTASYVNNAGDKNENYVFYNITTEEFRKSKVGGFLKKVKRIVERNNPISHLFSADDKQVASN